MGRSVNGMTNTKEIERRKTSHEPKFPKYIPTRKQWLCLGDEIMGDFSLLFVSLCFPIFYNKYFPFPLYLACVIYIVNIIYSFLKYFRLKLA